MSIRGSEKEFILSLALMKHKEILEQIIGLEMDGIALETTHGRKKVDLYSICPVRRLEVFVENQVTPSDKYHLLKHVLPLLQSINEGVVIWIASSFSKEHLSDVKSLLEKNRHKYINFYALKIHPDVLKHIESLNSINKLDVWRGLHVIKDILAPLTLVCKHEQIPATHIGKAVATTPVFELNRAEDVKEYVLRQLQQLVPECINLHKAKKHNQGDRVITVGAGKSGVYYKISANDRRGLAFVELFMDACQTAFFKRFKVKEKDMQRCIDPGIQVGNRKLGVYFNPDTVLDVTIKKIADIFTKMVHYFSPYIYEGWENVVPEFIEDQENVGDEELERDEISGISSESGLEFHLIDLLLQDVDNEREYMAKIERMAEIPSIW
ncbi:hypothetical protein [Brevibacillus brevis]|uniref:hypothetical protein n=1 Tax=Brevibacillus brevis TaxID=1393 RepID=UPI0037C732A2